MKQKKKYNWGKQNNLFETKKQETKSSVIPVTLKECKNIIYNIFAKPKYDKLSITKKAYIKLMCYINLIGDYEISGFGRIQDGIITDFKILKQEVKSAYVECSEDAVMDFVRSIPTEQLSEWELDWHSHVDMGTTPSGTDWDNYKSMSALRGHKQFPAMIVNKQQQFTLINYISENKHDSIGLYITDEDIEKAEIDAIYKEAEADIKANCTKTIFIKDTKPNKATYPTHKDYYSGYYGYDYNAEDDFDDCHCKSCGIPLINSHELTTGFCEDCEGAVGIVK